MKMKKLNSAKNHQKTALLKSILLGTDVLTLISAEVQHCRRKKRVFNSANNHQKLALLNNLCFGTVVLAINSAEVQHFRRKKNNDKQCPKSSKIGIVE